MSVPQVDNEMQQVAIDLIYAEGREVTLRKQSSTPIDPNKPWNGDETSYTTETTKGVFLKFMIEEIDGEIVKEGDVKVIVPYITGVDITEFEQLIDGSDTWKMKVLEPLTPGEVNYITTLRLRK